MKNIRKILLGLGTAVSMLFATGYAHAADQTNMGNDCCKKDCPMQSSQSENQSGTSTEAKDSNFHPLGLDRN